MPTQNRSAHENSHSETKNGKYASSAPDDIRRDLNALQSDVAILASDVKKAGTEKARDAINYVSDQVDSLRDTSASALVKLEENIKANPGQSITIAFVAGALVSFLLGRKS